MRLFDAVKMKKLAIRIVAGAVHEVQMTVPMVEGLAIDL
jgi:hypothetical protein